MKYCQSYNLKTYLISLIQSKVEKRLSENSIFYSFPKFLYFSSNFIKVIENQSLKKLEKEKKYHHWAGQIGTTIARPEYSINGATYVAWPMKITTLQFILS